MLDQSTGYLRLIDFGLAKEVPPGAKTFTLCGTAEYLAPEVVLGTGHAHAADWWSAGIVAYEVVSKETPFEDEEAGRGSP
jgi:serine/threonine protein kinase